MAHSRGRPALSESNAQPELEVVLTGQASRLLFDALEFAVEAHGRVLHERKGSRFPYLIHPVRVAWILHRHGYEDEIVAAGILHDTLEDTPATVDELERRFGPRVARLVTEVSQLDKDAPWEARKQRTIDSIATADEGVVAVLAADKLDNVRATREALAERGEDETWGLFKVEPGQVAWYYRALAGAFVRRGSSNLLFQSLQREVDEVFAGV